MLELSGQKLKKKNSEFFFLQKINIDHSKLLTSRQSPVVNKNIFPFALIRYSVSKCTGTSNHIYLLRGAEVQPKQCYFTRHFFL